MTRVRTLTLLGTVLLASNAGAAEIPKGAFAIGANAGVSTLDPIAGALGVVGGPRFTTAVSARYWFTPRLAIEPLFGMGAFNSPLVGGLLGSDTVLVMQIGAAVPYVIASHGPVNAYIGGNLLFGIVNAGVTWADITLGGLFGVEYFVAPRLSFDAQVGLPITIGGLGQEVGVGVAIGGTILGGFHFYFDDVGTGTASSARAEPPPPPATPIVEAPPAPPPQPEPAIEEAAPIKRHRSKRSRTSY